jgi:hypothetical protein
MRVKNLKHPSQDMAKRILTEVSFEDRLHGFSLRERSGPVSVTMYSFEDVVSLFNSPYPCLDFNELEGWVRETMGDKELSEQIAKAVRTGRSDQDRSLRIKKLMEERLGQCKKLV